MKNSKEIKKALVLLAASVGALSFTGNVVSNIDSNLASPSQATQTTEYDYTEVMVSALGYVELMNISKAGLGAQLIYDGYSEEEVVYAVDNVSANWNAEAIDAARSYMELLNPSMEALQAQLELDGYTAEEIAMAIHSVGYSQEETTVAE